MSELATLPNIPRFKIQFPPSRSIPSALAFAKKHLAGGVLNHVARTAYWAVILAKKVPPFAASPVDAECLVLTCILHDMGLASSSLEELKGLTADKRFEVDGANIARDFVRCLAGMESWDDAKIERMWMAIALHTTASIARHAAPEIALSQMAIEADFAGPFWSPSSGGEKGAWITDDEYEAVMALFPRLDFNREGVKKVMCGLCHSKPSTTYSNFLGMFGVKYGTDGVGGGRAEYTRQWQENQPIEFLLDGLDALETLPSPS